MLIDTLKADLLSYRKDGTNKIAISLLTTLVGEAQRVGFDDGKRQSTDDEVVATIKKFIKGLNETIDKASSGNRSVENPKIELAILSNYLPKQLDEGQLKLIIDNIVADGHTTKSDIMRRLKEMYNGQFDGKLAASVVTQKLG